MKHIIATLLVIFAVQSSTRADDLVSTTVLDHLGLTQSWARPITAPWGADSIAHQELVVMEDQPVFGACEVADAASAQPADEGQPAGDAPSPNS